MTHRRNILKTAGVIGTGCLAGCLGGDSDGEYTRPVDIEEWPPESHNNELNTWNWYAEWNEWGTEAFAEEYDLDSYSTETYAAPGDWFTNLQSNPENHGIDQIGAFSEWQYRAVEEDLLEPIPIELMPNVEIPDQYLDAHRDEFWSEDGAGGLYGVPHAVVISPIVMYNTEELQDPGESIDILWDEEFADEISMIAHQPAILCEAGALYTGQDPTDPDDFEEIQEVLEQQRDLVFTYADDHQTQMQLVMSGDATLGSHMDGRAFRAIYNHGGDVDWFIPEEGATWGTDTLVIPKNAPNPVTSTMYLDYLFSDEGMEQLIDTSLYRPPVANDEFTDGELGEIIRENWTDEWEKEGDAEDFIDDLVLTEETMDNLYHNWPRSDEVIERYDEIWTAVTAG